MTHEIALLLERHFETAFAAPDGIKKLRELILTLAMQGKLVPQDLNDPPASKLLKEIESEKQRLVKEGKIKKAKPLPKIRLEEMPYELPLGWKWVRTIDIVDVGTGSTPAKTNSEYYGGTIPWYTSSSTNKSIAEKPDTFITEKALKETNCKIFPAGSLIIALYGQGKTRGQISEILISGATNQAIAAMVFYDSSKRIKPYIKHYFVKIYDDIRSLAEGAAQPNLNVGKIKETLIPLPPLPEQRRIVAKIDQLMARCDELEKLRVERDQKRLTVHTAVLNRLLDGNGEFEEAWGFITEHFGELYSVRENVAELRKAILQLAVMGKLVPQDPNDPPASELLKEIEAEKQRLVKEGKIKKAKPLPEIKPEEVPYEAPERWEWANLQDLLAVVTDGDHQAPPKAETGIPFLVIGNLNTGKVILDKCRFVPHDYYESLDWARKPGKNDILYTVTGSYGIPIFIDSEQLFCVQRHVAILKTVQSSPVEYLTHLLKSEYALRYATSVATGIAQKTVPLTGLRKMPIAFPPVNEQHRIVAKIDQLMALCDTLEQHIDAATHKQTALLNAVMAQV